MTWMSRLLAALLLVCMIPSAVAADLDAQRAEFKLAWAAAQQGDLVALTPYLNELADYPLYPYLRYAYLDSTLPQQPAGAVLAFLKQQAQLPVADRLRHDWLLELAKQGDWDTFLAHYQDDTAPALRCAAVSAHLAGADRQDRDTWIIAAQHLWLTPRAQPATCEAAFQYLKAHHRITNGMVTQRIQEALQARHYALARQLLPQLSAVDRPWARIWLEMAADPASVLDTMQVPDEPRFQTMLISGVQLVARTDPMRARHLWTELSHRYHFDLDDARDMQVRLALESAWHQLPDAAELLERVKYSDDPRITEWRIRTALRNGDWKTMLKFLPALGPKAAKPEWRYWKARALAATGQTTKAAAIYQTLADGMDYYGFLAADRLDLSYDITQEPSQPELDVIAQLGVRPDFVRARELFHAGLYSYANAEWAAASTALSRPARCQTALLAQQWGWDGRAIQTFANAGCWDDLSINYPLAFQDTLAPRAQALNLNLPWVYGLIRSESVFRPDAKSPVGALGLMQLMPATGHRVAANLDLILDGSDALMDPATNLTLGSAYLSNLLKRFNNSEPLATAAYNAGPERVNAWLPQSASLPADVWVDTIPFWETRNYVRNVLSAAVIFDWRLHNIPERLSVRLGTIPTGAALTAETSAPTAAAHPDSPP
ncbi:MAG: transglycosylase SLT domain-containing protein [Gammaproteobacteria bacterium]